MSSPPTSPGRHRSLPPDLSVPPFPPTLHHALSVHLTAEGLVLRPTNPNKQQQSPVHVVRIPWGTSEPATVEWGDPESEDVLVEGVAGILNGFADKYLLVITKSDKVANLPDAQQTAVRTVRSLLAVPLSSLEAAQAVVAKHVAKQAGRHKRTASVASTLSALTRRSTGAAARGEGSDAASSAESSDDSDTEGTADEADAAPDEVPQQVAALKPKRPFWQRAFSRSKASPSAPPAVEEFAQADEVSTSTPSPQHGEETLDPNEASPPDKANASDLPDIAATATATPSSATNAPDVPVDEEVRESQRELDQKLVAECIRTFTGLYFSHTGDITRSLQARHDAGDETLKHLPLWRLVDKRYWFNRHLIAPFVQAGLHSYIFVLMQGFCEQRTVPLPLQPDRALSAVDPSSPTSIDLDLVIISRRSIERPGLRYQRRGINDEGGVANFVETEFIVSCVREGARHTCSFIQIRGSMPLYWSQSPFALKPPLVLERTKEESRAAMRKHLDGLRDRYGHLVLVNLAESTGAEGAVVNAYGAGVKSLDYDEKEVRYINWDFHKATKGFHYENLSQLTELIAPDLEDFAAFWSTPSQVFSKQQGVPRLSCSDSCDRTNLSQSAVARWVLRRHLVHLGITSGEEQGMHDDLDLAFNVLWADNGDAISRQYAGTSALKGDYTRTGKRDWRGAVNDASNSMARLLQGTVTDFFKQAALEHILGVNPRAFEEFSARFETSDPSELLRLSKIRQEAVDTSCREVLSAGESKVAAWTLLSPSPGDNMVRPPSKKSGGRFEEKVLVLSNRAVHVISYDYTLQKVSSTVRIPLASIKGVQTGAYILSSLDAAARDPTENHGFLLRFVDEDATEQMRTYSLRTTPSRKSSTSSPSTPTSADASPAGLRPLQLSTGKAPAPEMRFIAFKALRRDAIRVAGADGGSQIVDRSTTADEGKTGRDIVRNIVGRIREECERVGVEGGWEEEEKDIISVAESRAQTSIVDKLTHSLARAVWA